MMVTTQPLRIIPFVPPSNPPLSSTITLQSRMTSKPIPSLTSHQETHKPPAPLFPFSGGLSWAELNAMMKTGGREHALANNDDESDDDLPSVEELLRIGKVSRTKPTPQHQDLPVPNGVAIQVDRTQSGLGERPGDSSAQPMVLDDDDELEEECTANESDDGAGDIEKGDIVPDASPQSTLETSKRASNPPTKPADIFGPWYDVNERRYVDWPVPDCRPRTPRDVSCSPAPDQSKALRALSVPPQDQISEQRVCETAPSSFRESGARPSNQNANGSEDGWTEDQEAELEKELALVLVEQGNTSPTSAPSPPRSRSADALLDDAMTQECTEITVSSREELRLEEWEQQQTQVAGEASAHREQREKGLEVDGGEVEMQQQEEVRKSPSHPSSHARSMINLTHPATPINNGHHHTLPRSASPLGPSGTALCDKTALGDPGEKRVCSNTYREVGSESVLSDDSDDGYDEGNADLRPAKRRKPYVAPAPIASPRFRRPPSSTSLELDDTQSQTDDGCPSTAVDGEQHCASYTSRNPSMAIEERSLTVDEEFDELATDTRSQQGYDTDGSDNSADEDYAHDVGDDGEDEEEEEEEENTRPTRQRKSPLHSRDKGFRHRQSPASTLNEQLHTPRRSRTPPAAQETQSSAEYREWSFGGSFKSVRIGSQTTFNLEFTLDDLDDVPEQLELSAAFKAIEKRLSLRSSANTRAVRSTTMPPKNQHKTSCSLKKRNLWTVEEDAILKRMREEDDCSWEEISAALPLHTQGSIQVRYSNKFSDGTGSRKRRRL